MNVSERTIQAIQEMINESFTANARIDRMKSVLDAVFAYNNTSNKLHLGIAHKYPIIADRIGDSIEGYNIPLEYGNIPKQVKEYASVEEIIEELMELTIDFQNKLNMCANIASVEMDLHVYSDLLPVIREHNDFVRQAILLYDKIKLYKDNPAFDHHIDTFFFLEV